LFKNYFFLQPFPADLIGLVSDNVDGNIFIETGALDGEKNLKPRYAIKESRDNFRVIREGKSDNFEIEIVENFMKFQAIAPS
jgi:magnesium-transporting ATPase (P-type)